MSEKRDLYRGAAEVVGTDFMPFTEEKCKEWKKWDVEAVLALPEAARKSSMKVIVTVKGGDGVESEILLPYYAEQLTGEAIGWYKREDGEAPTRMDETLAILFSQKLIQAKTDEEVVNLVTKDEAVGKTVYIRRFAAFDDNGDQKWTDTKFDKPLKLLRGGDRAARLAAMRAGKPYEAPQATVAAPQATVTAIPLPNDTDDMPF